MRALPFPIEAVAFTRPTQRLGWQAATAAWLFGLFAVAAFALVGRGATEVRDARPLAGWLGTAALAALYAVPAVLIVLSRDQRPGLLVVAGVVGIAPIPT